MTNLVSNYDNPLNLTVALVQLMLGVFGVICNSSILFVFHKEQSERNSFNLICVFRSLSNIYILLTTFLGLFMPKTFLGYSLYSPPVECWLIHISNTLYMGNEYQIVLVAVNRFIAMFIPFHYQQLCGFKTTLMIILLIYAVRIVVVIIETLAQLENDCFTFYSLEALAWKYDQRAQCQHEDNILAVISFTLLITTALNGATLIKIIQFYKTGGSEDRETKRRVHRNILLFFQTGLQDSLYLVDLFFMLKLSQLSDARLWSYISGTFVWQCLHSIDGSALIIFSFIMLMFNERLSLLKKQLQPKSDTIVPPPKLTVFAVSALPEVG